MNEKKNYTVFCVVTIIIVLVGTMVGGIIQQKEVPDFLQDKQGEIYCVVAGYNYPGMNRSGRQDALLFKDFLMKDLGIKKGNIKSLTDPVGFTKTDFRDAISTQSVKMNSLDTLLIFFSGYGLNGTMFGTGMKLGTYYENQEQTPIYTYDLDSWTTGFHGNVSLILDTDFARGVLMDMNYKPEWAFVSCGGFEMKKNGEGVFTREFIEAFREKNALNESEVISFDSVNTTVISNTISESGQHPVMYTRLGHELFIYSIDTTPWGLVYSLIGAAAFMTGYLVISGMRDHQKKKKGK